MRANVIIPVGDPPALRVRSGEYGHRYRVVSVWRLGASTSRTSAERRSARA